MALQAIGLGFESPYLHIAPYEAFSRHWFGNRSGPQLNEIVTAAGRASAWRAFDDGSLKSVCGR